MHSDPVLKLRQHRLPQCFPNGLFEMDHILIEQERKRHQVHQENGQQDPQTQNLHNVLPASSVPVEFVEPSRKYYENISEFVTFVQLQVCRQESSALSFTAR